MPTASQKEDIGQILQAGWHLHRTKMAVVMYLDLDGFKEINNRLGHTIGDTLLKMVARRLVEAVRDEDTVARLSGDEFAVALWHVGDDDDAARVAAKVIEAVSRPYDIDGHAVSVTTSAGVALYPVHGEDADTLLKSADSALYDAKRAGKNAHRMSVRVSSSA